MYTGFHGLIQKKPQAYQWPQPTGGMSQPAPTLPSKPSAQVNVPPAQQYSPYAGGSQVQQNVNQLAQYGQGLMNPNSDYYQRLSQAMQQQIGGQTAAQQRASALRGAWSGLGGGASPEQMATAAQLGQAGLEAQGQAESGLALQAPQLGASMVQSTFAPGVNLQQLGEQSRQFGAGLGEQQRQYGGNLALQQQQLGASQAWQQAQLQQAAQQQQLQALMSQLSMMYGMF